MVDTYRIKTRVAAQPTLVLLQMVPVGKKYQYCICMKQGRITWAMPAFVSIPSVM